MAHSVNSEAVVSPPQIWGNVDSSGNVEQRGAVVFRNVDITSYAAPEVITAGELGLSRIYGALFIQGENSAHAFRAAVPASDGTSISVTVDDAGSGTQAGSDDLGEVLVCAWGEGLGTGANS